MVGLMTLNDLEIALRQNMWLEEILERFEEIVLPDSWLVAALSRRQSGICVANNRPSLASKMSISYISMNKIYRLRPRPVMRDAFRSPPA
jgi:hypothetical protein